MSEVEFLPRWYVRRQRRRFRLACVACAGVVAAVLIGVALMAI